LKHLFQVIETIESSPYLIQIFQNCPYKVLKTLEIVSFLPGQFLCHQGQRHNNLFIIISGKVEVYYQAENGKIHMKCFFQEGTFLGELELYDQSPAVSYVRAVTTVTLLRLKRETFMQWLKLDNYFCEFLLKQVSKKYYDYSLTTSETFLYSIKYRICNYLISYCKELHKTTNVEVEFDKNKFAKLFSVTTRSLNRTLQNLQDLKAIEIHGKTITVKDVQILKEIQGIE